MPNAGRPGTSGPGPAVWSASTSKLDLLRRYGAFTTDAKVWIYGDPLPVIETADRFGDLPRFSYQLHPAELERVQAALAEAGLPSSTLVPRRARVSKR